MNLKINEMYCNNKVILLNSIIEFMPQKIHFQILNMPTKDFEAEK